MSLLPLILEEMLENRRQQQAYRDLLDQNFGLNLLEPRTSVSMYIPSPMRSGYLRPWRTMSAGDGCVSGVQGSKGDFRVSLDVQQFKPEELKVQVVDDFLVVEASHDERSDEHGFISRQFTRRYKLPEDVDIAALVSKLSSDGVLTIEAPKKSPESKVRQIPITHTNTPAVNGQQSEEVKAQPEKMDEK